MELAKVTAMCMSCRQGFVHHNLRAPCFRCGGKVMEIAPIPNEPPYTCGHFVRQLANGESLPQSRSET